jgi:hypothetical protein
LNFVINRCYFAQSFDTADNFVSESSDHRLIFKSIKIRR